MSFHPAIKKEFGGKRPRVEEGLDGKTPRVEEGLDGKRPRMEEGLPAMAVSDWSQLHPILAQIECRT